MTLRYKSHGNVDTSCEINLTLGRHSQHIFNLGVLFKLRQNERINSMSHRGFCLKFPEKSFTPKPTLLYAFLAFV